MNSSAPNNPKPKPQWLERLEQESYQAELIVSGVALLGAFQLPGLLDQLLNWCLQRTTAEQQELLGYLFIYLLFGAFILIFNFVLHFSLRTLWIGNIGLASVFPEGINEHSDRYSPHFLARLKARFPDLQGFNQRLDDFCSLLFSIAGVSLITFIFLTILLMAFWGIGYLLSMVFAGLPATYFALGGLFLLASVLLFQGMLNHKKLRDKSWAKKIQFPLYLFSVRIMTGPFLEPFTYIGQTLATNVSKARYIGVTAGYMVLLVIGFVLWVQDSNLFMLDAGIRKRVAGRESEQYAERYENLRPPGAHIRFAMLSSDVIRGTVATVFVPVPKTEREFIQAYCGPEWEDGEREERQACLKSYYTFKIDSTVVVPSGLYLYEQKDSKQSGIRVYLPMQGQRVGGHHLRIIPARFEQDSFLINIPFQYFPEEALQ